MLPESDANLPASAMPADRVGSVVIGRNEGLRLERCLRSLVGQVQAVVYVDSGSTDNSVAFARSLGVDVLELDLSKPFTAARSRNSGLSRLVAIAPEVRFVQFVDGDCEMFADWLPVGLATLEADASIVAVAGRVRERRADATIYNRLCALEWDQPAGEVRACGGIALMRIAAVQAVGGFRETLVAGEEPELCYRMRQRGGRILRLKQDMCWHDADMTRFSQWWRRHVRAGVAYTESAALHGRGPERYAVRNVRSAIFWSTAPLLAAIGVAFWNPWWAWAPLAAYFYLWYRTYTYERRIGRTACDARVAATFTFLSKWPQVQGVWRSTLNRWRRKPTGLIEWKQAPATD